MGPSDETLYAKWVAPVTELVPENRDSFDYLGWAVDITGSYAILTAPADEYGEENGGERIGTAYVFEKNGENSWGNPTKLTPPDAAMPPPTRGSDPWFQRFCLSLAR
jgi:hypothetical protein